MAQQVPLVFMGMFMRMFFIIHFADADALKSVPTGTYRPIPVNPDGPRFELFAVKQCYKTYIETHTRSIIRHIYINHS